MSKDVHLAQELAQQHQLQLEGVDLVVKRYEDAMEKNLGRKDFSATYQLFDEK